MLMMMRLVKEGLSLSCYAAGTVIHSLGRSGTSQSTREKNQRKEENIDSGSEGP